MRGRLLSVAAVFVTMLSAGGVEVRGVCPSTDLTGDCFVDSENFALMANQWLSRDPNILDDTSSTDNSVENGISYYYAVAAVNDFGEGQHSEPVNAIGEWNDWTTMATA